VRYAIYFMPAPETPLWRFGSSIIGYDAAVQRDIPHPVHPAFDAAAFPQWTGEPRRYGFHATLKAPFALRDGKTEADLLETAKAFAADRRAFSGGDFGVAALGDFVALVPSAARPALHALADDATRVFERFRAPLSQADRERRLRAPLTERQIGYLDAWGYPYVFEDFRFHMTLTGPLPPDRRERVRAGLADLYGMIARPVRCDAIAVFIQRARDQRFAVLARYTMVDGTETLDKTVVARASESAYVSGTFRQR